MRAPCLFVAFLPALMLHAGQTPRTQPKPATTASGVFVGRSGKPLAKARVIPGQISSDQEVIFAKLKLLPNLAAVTDEQGRFQLKGFPPDSYVLVYQLAGSSSILPVEINIKPLVAVTRSTMPLLKGVEIGKAENYPNRIWGRVFTLLKGHTFLSQGEYMKIWNATLRLNPAGPYLEMRKGALWEEKLGNNSQIKLEAWSF